MGELWYSFEREFFIFGFDGDWSYVCICGECREFMMRKGIEKGRTMEENDGFRLFFKDVPRVSGGGPCKRPFSSVVPWCSPRRRG